MSAAVGNRVKAGQAERLICIWSVVLAACCVTARSAAQPAEEPESPATQKQGTDVSPAHEEPEPTDWGCAGPPEPSPVRAAAPGQPSDESPRPRWACNQETVVARPVWQGRPARFSFTIRNEGTADLLIQTKAG